MKITIASLLFAAMATSTFAADPAASNLRKAGPANIERRRPDNHDGGNPSPNDDDDEKKHQAREKHGQGILTIHGLTRDPLAEDVAVIEQAMADAYNTIHPNSDWEMTAFHDTWAQVFEEENDPPALLGTADAPSKLDRYINPNWSLRDIWAILGGYWSVQGCKNCPDDRFMSASDKFLMEEKLESSAVGDELCDILLDSKRDIFKQVYDCSVSTKPATVALVEAMRKPATKRVE